MTNTQFYPKSQKLSILIATILLAFAIARYVNFPGTELSLEFAGILFPIEININTFIAVIVAGLTASGTDWILRDHPKLSSTPSRKHWLVPGLTAWVISFPLSFLSDSSLWWFGFAAAGIVVLIVVSAEYISSDPDDIRQPFAATVLVSISFMLFIIFLISIRSVGLRLIYTLPAIALSSTVISLRVINFRLHTSWLFIHAIAISIIVTQVSASLHYLQISPLSFGLILFGLVYALVNFVVVYHQSSLVRVALTESSLLLLIPIIIAFVF